MELQSYYYGEKEKKAVVIEGRNVGEDIQRAKEQIAKLRDLSYKVEDQSFMNSILSIVTTSTRIIETVEREPRKVKKVESFFDYYLPVALKIVARYDEIENQRLVSSDSYTFMKKSRKMISELDNALKMQLSGMYQNDIVSTEADLKVLDMMLKSEGLNSDTLKVEK